MLQTVFHSHKKADKIIIYNFTTTFIGLKVKVKVTLEQTTKAQRGNRGKDKGKVHPTTGHEGPEGE